MFVGTGQNFNSPVTNGATAVAYGWNTINTLSTTSSTLLSVTNNGSQILATRRDSVGNWNLDVEGGALQFPTNAAGQPTQTSYPWEASVGGVLTIGAPSGMTVGSAGAANLAVDVPFTATGMEIFPGGAVIGQFEATTPVSVKGGPTTCTYTNSDCRLSGNAVANVSVATWTCACDSGNIHIYGQCGATTCAQTTGISFNGWVTRHN